MANVIDLISFSKPSYAFPQLTNRNPYSRFLQWKEGEHSLYRFASLFIFSFYSLHVQQDWKRHMVFEYLTKLQGDRWTSFNKSLFIIPYYFSLIIFLLSLHFLILMKYNSYIYVINYSLSVIWYRIP